MTLAGSESGPLGARPMDRLVQATSGAMPTRQIDKAELRDVVRMAMESLSERQRLAVLLNKFEGMSYADIADDHGVVAAGHQVAAVAGTGEPAADAGTVFRRWNPPAKKPRTFR